MDEKKLQGFSEIRNVRYVKSTYVDPEYGVHILHRHHDKLEILYVYSGEGNYQVDSREYSVQEGDLIICNENILHGERFSSKRGIETYCCAYKGVAVPGLSENCLISDACSQKLSLTSTKAIVHQLMPMIYHLNVEDPYEYTLAQQMALTVFMLSYMSFKENENKLLNPAAKKKEEYVRLITDVIEEEFIDPELRISEMCKSVHMSESYATHLYKKETGMSPKQYIMMRRVGEAQNLLENTDLKIEAVAEKTGFESICHFTTTFKKHIGETPTDYRKHFYKT